MASRFLVLGNLRGHICKLWLAHDIQRAILLISSNSKNLLWGIVGITIPEYRTVNRSFSFIQKLNRKLCSVFFKVSKTDFLLFCKRGRHYFGVLP